MGVDGATRDAASTFATLTDGVAEMQRLIEEAEPAKVLDGVPELDARLEDAEGFCAGR